MRRPLLATAFLLAGTAAYAAPPSRDPDWPCQQIKVSELSAASVWSGPAPDTASGAWASDPDVAEFARRLAQRRIPLDEARREIAAFADRMREDKGAKLSALFAGVFTLLDRERGSVIEGLDRYGKRQKQLADDLRSLVAQLRQAQSEAADPALTQRLAEQVTWNQRVFEDRRQSLSYACEVPATIEQRVFGLARAIQEHMQ